MGNDSDAQPPALGSARDCAWLADWAERQIPQELKPSSETTWGMTQLRLVLHVLGAESDHNWTVDGLQYSDQATRPVLVGQSSSCLVVFPGAHVQTPEQDADSPDRYIGLDNLPNPSIPAFQHLLDVTVRDPQFRQWYQDRLGRELPVQRPDADWFLGNHSLGQIRSAFEWFNGSDEALGVYFDDEQGGHLLPDGSEFGRCTNSAHLFGEQLGGEVCGFGEGENPDISHEAVTDCVSGHDFLVINDRYIVDAWVSVYRNGQTPEGHRLPMVYDLDSDDPGEQALNQALYGAPATWSVLERYPDPLAEPSVESVPGP